MEATHSVRRDRGVAASCAPPTSRVHERAVMTYVQAPVVLSLLTKTIEELLVTLRHHRQSTNKPLKLVHGLVHARVSFPIFETCLNWTCKTSIAKSLQKRRGSLQELFFRLTIS
jgi:hypothetical protein